MKIKICVPYYNEFDDAKPGLQELINCKEHEFRVETTQGCNSGKNRNRLVSPHQLKKQAPPGDWDAYLFVDSDMVPRAQDALALIAHDKDIISGAYPRSDQPEYYNAGMWNKDLPGDIAVKMEKSTTGLHKVDYVGAGFLLVRASVFSVVEYPWFRHPLISKDDCQEELSPDYGFCMGAHKAGLEVWVDCNTVIGHNSGKRKKNAGRNQFAPASIAEEAMQAVKIVSGLARKYEILFSKITKAKNDDNGSP